MVRVKSQHTKLFTNSVVDESENKLISMKKKNLRRHVPGEHMRTPGVNSNFINKKKNLWSLQVFHFGMTGILAISAVLPRPPLQKLPFNRFPLQWKF